MLIIHTSDLHLDSKMESNLKANKAKERKNELLEAFARMVNLANRYLVKVILIAGDMFDKSRVNLKTKGFIFDLIKTNPHIDFLYLSGNHDESNFISSFESLPNLKVFNDNWTSFKYDDVVISGIVLNESSKNHYFNTLDLDKSKFNIVTMHGQIGFYKNDEINLTSLKDKGIDYLALGHIHEYSLEKLDSRGVYCYSGCLEGRGFDELGIKGFSLIDTKTKEYKFIPNSKRVFHEVNVDISMCNVWYEINKLVLDKVKDIPEEDFVKVILKGTYELSLIKQVDILANKLNSKFYFAKVYDETSLKINLKDFEYEISLKGEFIRTVLESDLSDALKKRVIEQGIASLRREDD